MMTTAIRDPDDVLADPRGSRTARARRVADHRREAMVARQVRLTDALADELGADRGPAGGEATGGLWRVEIRVPVGRPAIVSRIVAITHDTLTRSGAAR